MFKTDFPGHKTVWGAQKYLGSIAPECPPWLPAWSRHAAIWKESAKTISCGIRDLSVGQKWAKASRGGNLRDGALQTMARWTPYRALD